MSGTPRVHVTGSGCSTTRFLRLHGFLRGSPGRAARRSRCSRISRGSPLASACAYSPDGKWVACRYIAAVDGPTQLAVIPSAGGAASKLFDMPASPISYWMRNAAYPNPPVRWALDGEALTYVVTKAGVSNIWAQALKGGPPQQLTHLKELQIFYFDWSPQGDLVLSRGSVTSDAVLIRNLR